MFVAKNDRIHVYHYFAFGATMNIKTCMINNLDTPPFILQEHDKTIPPL